MALPPTLRPAPQRYRRVLGYARVSSKQQALGSSLKDQQESISAGAESLAGLKVAPEDMHVEAVSSLREKIETRVQIGRLMAKVRKGDLVVVDKVDRWSRDPEFTYASIREIRAKGANVYFVGEGIDASTEDGDTQLNFRILFAREEAKRIRTRMVGTRKKLRDRGHWVEGHPPLGYRLPADEEEKHKLVVVAADVPAVRQIFKLTIAGKGASAIAQALGVPMQRVRSVLARARLYLGEQQDSEGRWIKAKHESLITPETYERSRLARAGRRTRGPLPSPSGSRTDSWILRDVARCAHCGGTMSSRYSGRGASKGNRGYRADYYVCFRSTSTFRAQARNREVAKRLPGNVQVRRPMAGPCKGASIRVTEVEALVEPMVKNRLAEIREQLLALGKKRTPEPVVDEAADVSALLARLAAKRERYEDAFGDGTLSKDAFSRVIAKVESEEMRLHELARKVARPKALSSKPARLDFLKRMDTLIDAWDRARPATKRRLVPKLVKTVAMARGEHPIVTWFTLEELGSDVV